MSERLVQTIEDLVKGIEAGSFRSEAEVSQGIVKRVLYELDWPVFNTQVVAPEFRIDGGRVDYALCHPPGKASILVEVKDLGKADGKGKKQLFQYCVHQGVPIAVLTDGRTWSFFFPAGQGSYDDRLFKRIDLLDNDYCESAKTLVRYLDMQAVKSQEARKRASEDYDKAWSQKQAVSNFESVWNKLLSEPEPLLLELFVEEVHSVTGVRPDPERTASFIRDRVIAGRVSPMPPEKSPPWKPGPRPSPSPRKKACSFTFRGRTETFSNATKLFGAVFSRFAEMDPDFCRRYSENYYGRSRKYVARSRNELYPEKPKLRSAALPLPNGWYIGTNISTENKIQRIREACTVMGLTFGQDIVVEIPV